MIKIDQHNSPLRPYLDQSQPCPQSFVTARLASKLGNSRNKIDYTPQG